MFMISLNLLLNKKGRPGHDEGHALRDALTAMRLATTLLTKLGLNEKAYLKKGEASALIVAGSYHDIATSIFPRYDDRLYACGHAEMGAVLVTALLRELLPPSVLVMAAYSIAAHTHYLKPIDPEIDSGYLRLPYPSYKDGNEAPKPLNGVILT